MSVRMTVLGLLVTFALVAGCTSEVPPATPPGSILVSASGSPPGALQGATGASPSLVPASPSNEPTVATPSSAAVSPSPAAVSPSPSPTPLPRTPTFVPEPSASPGPPYHLPTGDQDPHTILFGTLRGDVFFNRGQVYYVHAGNLAFAALFGEPTNREKLTFTFYSINGVRHSVIWSVTQPVPRGALGFADTLAGVGGPGVYGLGVTAGFDLLAWGSFEILPPCVGARSGG